MKFEPCPFCGMTEDEWDDWKVIEEENRVKCQNCSASAPKGMWNKRHLSLPDAAPETLEPLDEPFSATLIKQIL